MPERASVFETLQLGVEPPAAPGNPRPANIKVDGISVSAKPNLSSSRFRPAGSRLDTLVVPGRRWTEGSVEGRLTYNDIIYPLCSLFGRPTPTAFAVNPKVTVWDFGLNIDQPTTFQSYTMVVGSKQQASAFSHGVFTGLTIDFGTEEITLGGDVLGQRWFEGLTMDTPSLVVPLVPVDPANVTITVDETYGTLGTTVMTRVFAASMKLTGAFNPVWVIDPTLYGSFATVVDTAPDATLDMTFAADAIGMGFLDVFDQGATRYVQIVCAGPAVDNSAGYEIRLRFAAKCESVDFSDQDGVVGAAWTMRMVADKDLPGVAVTVRNTLKTLNG